MFEELKEKFLGAVNTGNYQEAKVIYADLANYLTAEQKTALENALNEAIQDQESPKLRLVVEDEQEGEFNIPPPSMDTESQGEQSGGTGTGGKADLTKVDWSGIVGATFGGIAAITNAANGTTPDNVTNVNNELKEEEKETPIGWYIGGGIGLLALIFVLIMLMNKKPK